MNYVKIALIVTLLGALVFAVIDYRTLRERNALLKEQVEQQEQTIKDAKKQLTAYNSARLAAEEQAKKAAKVRTQIITKYQDRIIEVTNQNPPTECEDVIKWAIERKSDLSWSR